MVHGKSPLLSKPLRKGHKSDTRRGQLEHDNIIGRRVRDLVQARKGQYLPHSSINLAGRILIISIEYRP